MRLAYNLLFSSRKHNTMTIKDYEPEVRSLIHTLKRHGFVVRSAFDGEDVIQAEAGHDVVVKHLCGVDESYLRVAHGNRKASLLLVLGNEPGVIVADYSYSKELGKALDAVIDEHSERWEERAQPTKEI